ASLPDRKAGTASFEFRGLHAPVRRCVKNLFAAPQRNYRTSGRDLPSSAGYGKGHDVDFSPSGLVGFVSYPFPVGREGSPNVIGRTLDYWERLPIPKKGHCPHIAGATRTGEIIKQEIAPVRRPSIGFRTSLQGYQQPFLASTSNRLYVDLFFPILIRGI